MLPPLATRMLNLIFKNEKHLSIQLSIFDNI